MNKRRNKIYQNIFILPGPKQWSPSFGPNKKKKKFSIRSFGKRCFLPDIAKQINNTAEMTQYTQGLQNRIENIIK